MVVDQMELIVGVGLLQRLVVGIIRTIVKGISLHKVTVEDK